MEEIVKKEKKMSVKKIKKYSFADCYNASKVPCKLENDVVLFEHTIFDKGVAKQLFTDVCKIDFTFVAIGTRGKAKLSINQNSYAIEKNTLIIIPRGSVCQFSASPDFALRGFFFSEALLNDLSICLTDRIPLIVSLKDNACTPISPEESAELHPYFLLIKGNLMNTNSPYCRKIVRGLITTILYSIGNVLHSKEPHDESKIISPGDSAIFSQFMELLTEHYVTERRIGFYAKQLDVEPKYLSEIIRRVSNKSASQWIVEFVIMESKNLLKNTTYNCTEIAQKLHFPTNTFFGKYFKTYTGVTPRKFRMDIKNT